MSLELLRLQSLAHASGFRLSCKRRFEIALVNSGLMLHSFPSEQPTVGARRLMLDYVRARCIRAVKRLPCVNLVHGVAAALMD
jgi:hypothetical protein